MTPQEMADWLAEQIGNDLLAHDETTARSVLAYLRAQPTDAQKIEALKLASDADAAGAGSSRDSKSQPRRVVSGATCARGDV